MEETLACRRKFTRSKLHHILNDRSYIGDIPWKGQWLPGIHEPIVNREVFNRVQVLLGQKRYQSHELTYAGGLIRCGHCGNVITGENRIKKTANGEKEYHYYRCSKYNAKGHPRIRLPERALDEQVMQLFDRIRIEDEAVRDWFKQTILAMTEGAQRTAKQERADLNRKLTMVKDQEDRLLNLRLKDEIDAHTYAKKSTDLRDQAGMLALQIEGCDRSKQEMGQTALRMFELSQNLKEQWLKADVMEKRQILQMVGSDYVLNGVTLCFTIEKPFDVLAEGTFLNNGRGDRI